jgi:hypothetical protein
VCLRLNTNKLPKLLGNIKYNTTGAYNIMSRTKADTPANYKVNGAKTQLQFLQKYLRGTNISLTASEASALFGIKKLQARLHECMKKGLKVRSYATGKGRELAYKVSARDLTGSRAKLVL